MIEESEEEVERMYNLSDNMTERKGLSIGIDDFKGVIENNYYFVDKTPMIKKLIDNLKKVNLFTRPRRFGKSLNLSMIQYYFEKAKKDNSYLFDGLAIMDMGDKYTAYQGQYPVINLSLKSMKQPCFEYAFMEYKNIIIREFERHRNILDSPRFTPAKREVFESIYNNKADDSVYRTAIRTLSDCLSDIYEKNVIILIDEYDVPLESAYFRGFYDEMVDLIRSAFESALKTNPNLEFAVLTGCLRVSKESIFTGLNNLKVHSITDEEYSEYFGFTEKEITALAAHYGILDKVPEMKKWYDGYIFGKTDIYNPWSILNYLDAAKNGSSISAKAYWSNTSSNDIIHKLIVEGKTKTQNEVEKLLEGESIEKPIYEDITYRNIDINSDYIWSFLLYTGYLKQIGSRLEDTTNYSTMTIPNLEVKSIYKNTVMQWFYQKINNAEHDDIFEAVISENTEKFEDLLNEWLDKTISYFDGYESYYHGFLSGMLSGFRGYSVKSNRESGEGRPDLLILERQKHKLAIIVEIKVAKKFADLENKCDEALTQIEDNNYQAELIEDCYKKIIKYGIAFHGKSCMVKLG